MSHKVLFRIAIFFALLMFGCIIPTPIPTTPPVTSTDTPTATLTPTVTFTATPTATDTLTPTLTPTITPSNTPSPTATNTLTQVPIPPSPNYMDDRSTPSQVIVSLYNAINRKEYLRAYSYWRDPASSLGSFSAYANGYQYTAFVKLVFGQITGDPGMSQVYYTIPVILKATSTSNVRTNYAACYVVHKTSADVYGAPPFEPMTIDRGSAFVSDMNASDASVLATACQGYPSGPDQVPVSSNPLNIDKTNFLDNRSGPIETVSSFLNALNRKQYVRAYSYFEVPATFPGDYVLWSNGYANTDSMTVIFGTVQGEGAAGSLYYKVPLATHVLTTANTTQTFVGCYTLRLVQPAVQGVPPFQPMGIISGHFNQVANSTNVNALLPTACN